MDKVQKIREEVARIQLYTQSEVLKQILDFIDSMHEEPISESIDFEQELYKAFGQIKDFTLGIAIAKRFYDMGRKHNEPVSEELEEAAFDYAEACKYDGGEKLLCVEHFKAGAKWQEEQFEKNRLAACDKQTEEEAEIEQSFVMGIIEKEHRQPTFDDAIKYGMRLKKKQMMAKAVDGEVGYWNQRGLSVLMSLPSEFEEDDKCKIILIKED